MWQFEAQNDNFWIETAAVNGASTVCKSEYKKNQCQNNKKVDMHCICISTNGTYEPFLTIMSQAILQCTAGQYLVENFEIEKTYLKSAA